MKPIKAKHFAPRRPCRISSVLKVCLAALALFFLTAYCSADTPILIQEGDKISVWVKGEPDLSVERVVSNRGSVELPLIGSAKVKGLSLAEAERLIEAMLEDGYLRYPHVKVSIAAKKTKQTFQKTFKKHKAPVPQLKPAQNQTQKQEATPCLIELVNAKTLQGIKGALLSAENKIYLSNELGQIVFNSDFGHAIVIAVGYKTFSGSLKGLPCQNGAIRLALTPTALLLSVSAQIICGNTQKPLANTCVRVNDKQLKTNENGVIIISELKKEYEEITVACKGYKTKSLIIDCKKNEPLKVFLYK